MVDQEGWKDRYEGQAGSGYGCPVPTPRFDILNGRSRKLLAVTSGTKNWFGNRIENIEIMTNY
jgi:hypothetical protein